MGKYSEHNEYFNDIGEEVPSVTTILKLMNKPFLMKWANIMGFKRQNIDQILKDSSGLGTNVHHLIEMYLKKETVLLTNMSDNNKMLLKMYINQFINWEKANDVKYMLLEHKVSCDDFGGTVDFYGKVNDEFMIIDFKTSKRVYGSMFLQLAAYTYMLERQGFNIDSVAILLVNSDKYEFKKVYRKDLDEYITTFLTLSKLFNQWYSITIKDKWEKLI